MPFAFDLLDEEEKKKQDAQGGGAPEMTGGGESFGGGAPASTSPQEKGTNKQGSGFVGLDKYMNANKASNFGGQLTGNVQGSVDQAKNSLSQGAQDFTNASNQGSQKWNDVGSQIKGIVDNAGDQTSKDDVSKLQGMAQAKYQGPESFYGSAYGSKAQGDVQKAAQQAKALQSEGGRFALLDQYYGRPNYSMGEKSLDNLLVQNNPGTGARAQSIGAQAQGIESGLGQTAKGLDNLAIANRAATTDTANQTRGYLGTAKSGFEDDLEKRYQDYLSQTGDFNQARQADVQDTALDGDTMGLYGLNPGDDIYDVNLGNYLQQTPTASRGQFASDQDYARYLALSQLSGEDPTLLSATDRAQAGTGSAMGKVSVDQAALKRDIADRQARYEQESAPIIDRIRQIQQYFIDNKVTPEQQSRNAFNDELNDLNAQWQRIQQAYGAGTRVIPSATPVGSAPTTKDRSI